MLRAPVIMKNIKRKNQKLPVSKKQRDVRRDNATSSRPRFTSVCNLATELSVLITLRNQKYENLCARYEDVFFKDDEDRFSQR